MYIESKLPDLVPVLKGSTDKIVQMDTDVLIDAGDSNDPAAGLSDVANTQLVNKLIVYYNDNFIR